MKKNKNLFIKMILIMSITITFIPVVFLLISSITGHAQWPKIFGDEVTFDAWRYVLFGLRDTYKTLGITVFIALIVTVINLILAIPAAEVLGRYDFKFKSVVEILIMLPIIFPPLIYVLGMYKGFIKLGLTDTLFGVIIVHIVPTLPYMIRALASSYAHIPKMWEEQGAVLHASKFKSFRYITLPMLLPGIVAGSTLTILISLSQYIITLLIGGGNVKTLSVVMFPYLNGGNVKIGGVYSIIFVAISFTLLWILDLFLKKNYERRS